MNPLFTLCNDKLVSAGCHINDVMNITERAGNRGEVSAGCHINDVMNLCRRLALTRLVSAGCHINDVMNKYVTY